MRKTWIRRVLPLIAAGAGLGLAGIAQAQTDDYYVFSDVPDEGFIIRGGVIQSQFVHDENDLAIAVGDTIRALDWSGGSNGSEYDLNGNVINSDIYAPIGGFVGQALDGSTNGTSQNYVAEWSGAGNVWATDRDWANGAPLFNTGLSMTGITYDAATDTLWVSEDNTGNIFNFDLSGNLLSMFNTGGGRWGALAWEPSTDSLWIIDNGTSEMRQYSKSGDLLTSQFGGGQFGNVWGGEFAMATPSPGAIALLGLAGLAGRRRRR